MVPQIDQNVLPLVTPAAADQSGPGRPAGDAACPQASGVDLSIASTARMYDYYLGGRDNFPADWETAEKALHGPCCYAPGALRHQVVHGSGHRYTHQLERSPGYAGSHSRGQGRLRG